jgi:hypothetical protein
MREKNGRSGAAIAIVLLASLALACGALKNLGGNSLAEANKFVQDANGELKAIDQIAEDNEEKVSALDKADKAGDAAEVKRLLDDLMKAIDEGLKHGEVAADKLDKASKLNVDDKYKEYLSLKSQSLRKQIEAFKERKEAARIMRDNYDNPDKTAMQKAKDDFKKKNANFKKLLGEAKDLSRKADDIARAHPDKIKPSA